jgi:hypothetical protein
VPAAKYDNVVFCPTQYLDKPDDDAEPLDQLRDIPLAEGTKVTFVQPGKDLRVDVPAAAWFGPDSSSRATTREPEGPSSAKTHASASCANGWIPGRADALLPPTLRLFAERDRDRRWTCMRPRGVEPFVGLVEMASVQRSAFI